MNARVRATSWLGGERVRATVNMLVERDGHLRFEAEVSLQGTVAALATDGTTFALLDAHKNELSRGPACPANVASLIAFRSAPADVAAVLLGDARTPGPIDPATASVGWDAHRGADVLAVPAREGGTLQFLFQRRRRGAHAGRDRSRRHGRRAAVADRLRGSRGGRGARVPRHHSFRRAERQLRRRRRDQVQGPRPQRHAAGRRIHAAPAAGATIVDVGCGGPPS